MSSLKCQSQLDETVPNDRKIGGKKAIKIKGNSTLELKTNKVNSLPSCRN